MLDKAGFKDVRIVLSNKLDEIVIWQIMSQIRKESSKYGVDADSLIKRLIYGVGTKLITSGPDPALDGVYKLTAVKDNNEWLPSIKFSESVSKIINPGFKKLWRLYDKRGKAVADLLSLENEDIKSLKELPLHHPVDSASRRILPREEIGKFEPLHAEVIKKGKVVYDFPSIEEIRLTRQKDLSCLDDGIKRIINPHVYHVSLSEGLWKLKRSLVKNRFG